VVIVVAESAGEQVLNASDVLAEYIQKSTGALLPIRTKAELQQSGEGLNGKTHILVGDANTDPHLPHLLAGRGWIRYSRTW
jgi:hypothetical protein